MTRDERTGGGERRADRRWRETSGPAVARDERTGGGERRGLLCIETLSRLCETSKKKTNDG